MGHMTTILIVDDEVYLRRWLKCGLALEGYTVLEAANGFGALALYVEQRPQLVVTDIFMPEKNGIELAREIRALDPAARLIAMSGGGETGELLYLDMIQHFGVAETICKPFRLQDLVAIIERVLSER
jgi:YesN/AraC family two-component response regulator